MSVAKICVCMAIVSRHIGVGSPVLPESDTVAFVSTSAGLESESQQTEYLDQVSPVTVIRQGRKAAADSLTDSFNDAQSLPPVEFAPQIRQRHERNVGRSAVAGGSASVNGGSHQKFQNTKPYPDAHHANTRRIVGGTTVSPIPGFMAQVFNRVGYNASSTKIKEIECGGTLISPTQVCGPAWAYMISR